VRLLRPGRDERIARREAFAARVESTVRALKAARTQPNAESAEAEVDDWGDLEHGRWRLARLERVAAEVAATNPRRGEQLAYYLEALRPMVGDDGLLPASVDRVVSESFDELLPS
jgi:hypothetical protein